MHMAGGVWKSHLVTVRSGLRWMHRACRHVGAALLATAERNSCPIESEFDLVI